MVIIVHIHLSAKFIRLYILFYIAFIIGQDPLCRSILCKKAADGSMVDKLDGQLLIK